MELLRAMNKMQTYMMDNKGAYLGFGIDPEAAPMTQIDRDAFEITISSAASAFSSHIDTLRRLIDRSRFSKNNDGRSTPILYNTDTRRHYHNIIAYLLEHGQTLSKDIDSLRKLRTKQQKETLNLLRGPARDLRPVFGTPVKPAETIELDSKKRDPIPAESLSTTISSQTDSHSSTTVQQQLEEENHSLLDELTDEIDQVHTTQSKLASISKMMDLFADKLALQDEIIASIHNVAVDTTTAVTDGNAKLRNATQHGVTFRFVMLFVLLVMSFSLLFLDWYD